VHRIRPRTSVLGGAAIGLIAGAAVYGAISSPAPGPTPTAFKPVSASRAITPASAAPCAARQTLEHGVCIVHVVRTVVIPAAGSVSNPSSAAPASVARAAQPGEQGESEHEDDAAERTTTQPD